MRNFASDFCALSTLYLKIAEDLSRILEAQDTQNPRTLVQSVLKNQECFARIGQMNSTVLQLSLDWKKHRSTIDAKLRNEISRFADAARRHAVQVGELCNLQAQRLQTARDKMGRDLVELEKGARYLRSVKPAKNNFPKFIDSLY
jgi:hypothetical protein